MSGSSKTVFTADVVTYDFLPEKYSAEKAMIVAELNIYICCDWQDAIDNWCLDRTTDVSDTQVKDALMAAQDQLWTQAQPPAGGDNHLGASNRVGSSNTSKLTHSEACETVQGMVYQIATSCRDHSTSEHTSSFFDGTASSNAYPDANETTVGKTVDQQFKDALSALLDATMTDTASTNSLSIDLSKVKDDLVLPSPAAGAHASTMVPVENGPTTKISELLSGFAFVPVLNRLVAGGNFAIGVVDGGVSGTVTQRLRFDRNKTADQTRNIIDGSSYLVFPVRIMFADDGETNLEGTFQKDSTSQNDATYYMVASGKDISTIPYVSTPAQDGGDDIKVYELWRIDDPPNFVPWVDSGTTPLPTKYVNVNEKSVVEKDRVDALASHSDGWSPVKGTSNIAFQLNIIFSHKLDQSGADAVGTMNSN